MSLKISVDGGGLGARKGERFGNYTFSENLIKALRLYDKKNRYYVYTFKNLKPKLFWLKGIVSLEEFKKRKSVFLALNQAIPIYTSGKIISFSHGLSFYFHPKYYSGKDTIRLNNQLNEMLNKSNTIIVSSIEIKRELESVISKLSSNVKIIVLPFGIPFDMISRNTPHVTRSTSKKYFLFVGMDHPIKNIRFIKQMFRKLVKFKEFKGFKLKLVTRNCPRAKLRNLYRNAYALLTASHYESFNLPVLEALSQGCPVVGLDSAIIPEMKKYVNVAKNEMEYLSLMKTLPKKPGRLMINKIKREFDWKNYVKKLVELYWVPSGT